MPGIVPQFEKSGQKRVGSVKKAQIFHFRSMFNQKNIFKLFFQYCY